MAVTDSQAPVRRLPEVAPLPPLAALDEARADLPNGLAAWAARRGGAALTEVRLVVPMGGAPSGPAGDAVLRVVAETLLTDASGAAGADFGRRLAALGFSATAAAGGGSLTVSMSGLDDQLVEAIQVLAGVLGAAEFDEDLLSQRVERLQARLEMEAVEAIMQSYDRLRGLLFGDHPYGRMLVNPAAASSVSASDANRLIADRLVPSGSRVAVVSPRPPASTLEVLNAAFCAWKRPGRAKEVSNPAPPAADVFGAPLLLDRPGSVQTSLWFGGLLPAKGHPERPALAVAISVLSDRTAANIRRRNAWSYSAGTVLMDVGRSAHSLHGAPVRTEVTLPALVEITHELHRIVALPIEMDELAEAVGSLQGGIAQRLGSRSGLAEELTRLAQTDMSSTDLADQTAAISTVTPETVLEAARTWLAPARMAMVAVGDAAQIRPLLELLGPVSSVTA